MTSVNANTQPDDDSISSGTSIPTIIACNSISILACLVTLSIYAVLSMKAKYKRLMRRISLVLAACMASSDLVLHVGNVLVHVLRTLTLSLPSAPISPGMGSCHLALCVHLWEAGCLRFQLCSRYSTLALSPSIHKSPLSLGGDLLGAPSASSS
jgi:hypothetical protein